MKLIHMMPHSQNAEGDNLPAQLNAHCLGWWEAFRAREETQVSWTDYKLFPNTISSFSQMSFDWNIAFIFSFFFLNLHFGSNIPQYPTQIFCLWNLSF